MKVKLFNKKSYNINIKVAQHANSVKLKVALACLVASATADLEFYQWAVRTWEPITGQVNPTIPGPLPFANQCRADAKMLGAPRHFIVSLLGLITSHYWHGISSDWQGRCRGAKTRSTQRFLYRLFSLTWGCLKITGCYDIPSFRQTSESKIDNDAGTWNRRNNSKNNGSISPRRTTDPSSLLDDGMLFLLLKTIWDSLMCWFGRSGRLTKLMFLLICLFWDSPYNSNKKTTPISKMVDVI